jgi:hypothetical protein
MRPARMPPPAVPAPPCPAPRRVRRNPLRLAASAGLWAAAWYLLSYLVVGGALFAAGFTAVTAAAGLAITLAGLPLLVGAAAVLRGCANVERLRLALVLAGPVPRFSCCLVTEESVANPRIMWSGPGPGPGCIAARTSWRVAFFPASARSEHARRGHEPTNLVRGKATCSQCSAAACCSRVFAAAWASNRLTTQPGHVGPSSQ